MDPLADKLTQLTVLTTLAVKGIIPVWMIIVLAIKECTMIAGASFLYGKELVVSSKWYGKLATVLFYLAIVSSLAIKYFSLTVSFDIFIYYLALIFTIFSLVMYFNAFVRQGYLKKEAEELHKIQSSTETSEESDEGNK